MFALPVGAGDLGYAFVMAPGRRIFATPRRLSQNAYWAEGISSMRSGMFTFQIAGCAVHTSTRRIAEGLSNKQIVTNRMAGGLSNKQIVTNGLFKPSVSAPKAPPVCGTQSVINQ